MRWRLPLPVLAVVAVVTLATSSCLSPTLPLPPPEQPSDIRPGADAGTWIVSGACNAGAIVYVFNERTGMGEIVEDLARTGSYSVTLAGKQCDAANVYEYYDAEYTAPTEFVLVTDSSGDPEDNPLCQ